MSAVRVAIYTRLPTDGRRGRALAGRQARLTRAVGGWPGCALVGAYADIGVAGRRDWPGLARLVADAAARGFDAVVVDDLDRLNTDSVRRRAVLERLAAAGVAVWPLLPTGRRRAAAGWLAVAVAELLSD